MWRFCGKTQHTHTFFLASGQTQPQTPPVNMDLKGKTDNYIYKMCIIALFELAMSRGAETRRLKATNLIFKTQIKSHSVKRLWKGFMGIRNRLGARLILGMICADYQNGFFFFNIFKQSGLRGRVLSGKLNIDCLFWLVLSIYLSLFLVLFWRLSF